MVGSCDHGDEAAGFMSAISCGTGVVPADWPAREGRHTSWYWEESVPLEQSCGHKWTNVWWFEAQDLWQSQVGVSSFCQSAPPSYPLCHCARDICAIMENQLQKPVCRIPSEKLFRWHTLSRDRTHPTQHTCNFLYLSYGLQSAVG
jgi:hypothetical protein